MSYHPANLQVIPALDNTQKGSESWMSLSELDKSIRQFNKRHGTVLIPIDTAALESVQRKYSAISANRSKK
jgi:hypothetical protein